MHPNPSQFKTKLLKPPKMVKFSTSCSTPVGFSSDMCFFKGEKVSHASQTRARGLYDRPRNLGRLGTIYTDQYTRIDLILG